MFQNMRWQKIDQNVTIVLQAEFGQNYGNKMKRITWIHGTFLYLFGIHNVNI